MNGEEQSQRGMGRRLADARIRAGMSQADLGAVIGVSGPRVSHFESGHSIPKASYRVLIANALKVEPDVLFGPGIYPPLVEKRPVRRLSMGKKPKMGKKPNSIVSVNRQIIRLIEGMSARKRLLALSLVRSISRSQVLK